MEKRILWNNCEQHRVYVTPVKKPRHITWYYIQWQRRYEQLQSSLGNEITFVQGLPELSDDLHEINPQVSLYLSL